MQEGKLAEAENYISASWHNEQHGEVGQHLGELAAKRGDHRAALHAYQLAAAATESVHFGANGLPVTEASPELREHIRQEQKAGATPLPNARQNLQSVRTLPLGAYRGANLTAEYKLLLAHGKVVNSALSEAGRSSPAGTAEILKRLSFSALFPKDSDARLIKHGILNCHGAACEFILLP